MTELARYLLRKLSRRPARAAPSIYLAYLIGPEALAVGVRELNAHDDEGALRKATLLFHDELKRVEVWCGTRKVGDISPKQNDVS